MISDHTPTTGDAPPTLEQMVRLNAQRFGAAIALIDAPDRPLWTDGAPRRLNWMQVDAAVSAVAARFFELGVPSEAVICIQGINVSDTLIGMLGAIRAGLAVAILPLDAAPEEVVSIAERLNAKAILSARKIGSEQPLQALSRLVDESAADIRFIGAFGSDLPGAAVSFEDCIAFPGAGKVTRLARRERPEDSLAILTFDRTPDGMFAVARNHREWHAAGALFSSVVDLTEKSCLLSPMAPSGLAGLATGMVAWLVSGCQFVLHQPFDITVLAVQMTMHGVTHLVMPDTVTQALIFENVIENSALEIVASISREPHRHAALPETDIQAIHFAVLGETGFMPAEEWHGKYLVLPEQIVPAERDGPSVIEGLVDSDGELILRGAQVPLIGFDVSDNDALYPIGPDGWVGTYYPAISWDEGIIVAGQRHGRSERQAELLQQLPRLKQKPDGQVEESLAPAAMAGAA